MCHGGQTTDQYKLNLARFKETKNSSKLSALTAHR